MVRRAPAVSPALRHLWGALNRALRLAGPGSGAEVYDLTADTQLFALRERVMRPPASLEKLYTTVVLLRKLGSGARLRTSILGFGHLGARGVWRGDLYLRGGGDPTFGDGAFNRVYELGYGPTAAQLATQLHNQGIRRVTGSVIGDASLFDGRPGGPATGFAPDIADLGGQISALVYDHGSTTGTLSPGAFAARQMALTLQAVRVRAKASPTTARAPDGARSLASVSSPPLSVLLRLMDVPSDDLFAEMLTKQLGVRSGAGGSTAAGARVISTEVTAYGVHPQVVDGSGLSRSDRSSPREVVALLRGVAGSEIGRVLETSLPVVGVTGTTRSIATGTAAQGHCVAKTGTLDNVTNLAGYCHSRGRRTLAFAVFIDGPPNTRALRLIGQMVAAVAKY